MIRIEKQETFQYFRMIGLRNERKFALDQEVYVFKETDREYIICKGYVSGVYTKWCESFGKEYFYDVKINDDDYFKGDCTYIFDSKEDAKEAINHHIERIYDRMKKIVDDIK